MTKTQRTSVHLVLFVAAVAACQSSVLTGAKVYIQNGDYEKALEAARRASTQEPNNPEAHFVLGVAYSGLDSVSSAFDAFMRSVALDPQNAKRARWVEDNIKHNFTKHYQTGRSAFEREDYAESVKEFTRATKADPRDPRGFYNLGAAYAQTAVTDSSARGLAADAFQEALARLDESEPLYVRALEALGSNLSAMGRFEDAAGRYREALAHDPTRLASVEAVAMDLLDGQQWRGAVAILEVVVDAQKTAGEESYATHYNLGLAYSKLRDIDPDAASGTTRHFEAAHELNPTEPDAVMSLMVMAMWGENWGQAAEWGEKYVRLAPDRAQAWRLLARCYSETGERNKARDCLARARALAD
jgi:protein O-GlcNAc transferase